jgi:hypothetical protein
VARNRVRKLRLFQANGYLSLDLGSGEGVFMRLREDRPQGIASSLGDVVETIRLEADERDALGEELGSFVRSVRGLPEHVVSGREGRAALALAFRVAEAIRVA